MGSRYVVSLYPKFWGAHAPLPPSSDAYESTKVYVCDTENLNRFTLQTSCNSSLGLSDKTSQFLCNWNYLHATLIFIIEVCCLITVIIQCYPFYF